MPIYEFSCSDCHQNFEQLVRSMDWKGVVCPKCGSKQIAKQLSVFASQSGSSTQGQPPCTSNPSSCGRCGTGVPHSHG